MYVITTDINFNTFLCTEKQTENLVSFKLSYNDGLRADVELKTN